MIRLYPFTSHWSLRFSTTTRPHLSRHICVCLHADHRKDYTVTHSYMGQPLGKTDAAEKAVALAVRNLPADLPPTTHGTDTSQ